MNFSVIIPVYNLQSYILRALSSLENQTLGYKYFEVIIVNDGSTDNSLDVITNYIKSTNLNIKVTSQSNAGVSSARNNGIHRASGKYLYFMDGDDYIANDFLELVKADAKISSSDLLITSYTKVCDDKNIKFVNSSKTLKFSDSVIESYFMGGLNLHLGGLIFKRKKLNELGLIFDTSTAYGEDLEFFHKFMSRSNTVSIVTDAVFYYVYRSNSAVNQKVGLKREDALYAIIRVDEYIKAIDELKGLHNIYQVKYIPAHILKVVFNLVAEGDIDNASRLVNKKKYRHYIKCAELLGLQSFKIKLLYYTPKLYVHILAKIQMLRKFLL
jgi:glycosyltransferase involved in cell wall biosynthesis